MNAERAARGLRTLEANGALTGTAVGYARTLLRLNALNHSADGTSLTQRVRAGGYSSGSRFGEVLWASTGSLPPGRTVSDWLASPTHNNVLLDPTFRVAGVGCYFRQAERLEARCVMDLAG